MVTLQFIAFDTEKKYDYVTITDGDGTSLLGKTSGNTLPPNLVSKTNVVDIKFRTDHSKQLGGWKINWIAQPAGMSVSS